MTCDPLYFGRLRKEDEVMTYKSRFRLSVLKLTQTTFGCFFLFSSEQHCCEQDVSHIRYPPRDQ